LLRIVADSGKRIDELLSDVPPFVSTPEIRIDTDEDTKFAVMSKAVPHFSASYDVIDVDGVRVLFGDGWGLLRASNTQPVIVARYEARTQERLEEIRAVMEGWVREQGVSF
jgi:phosphomannomutase / phosphoglucomutase